jgi:hypothetical protein
MFLFSDSSAQDTITPGSSSINQQYLRSRSVFQKLSWFDSTGRLVGQATLNLITRIDSINKKLIFLQIRHDGKKDSTIAEWPSLRPIYTSTTTKNQVLVFDYHEGSTARTSIIKDGKKGPDSTYTIPYPYFDDYLTEYLYGALPLKPGYHAQFTASSGASVRIKDVCTDILISGDAHTIQTYLVQVEYASSKSLYWIDKSSGEIVKAVYQLPQGYMFMKSRI